MPLKNNELLVQSSRPNYKLLVRVRLRTIIEQLDRAASIRITALWYSLGRCAARATQMSTACLAALDTKPCCTLGRKKYCARHSIRLADAPWGRKKQHCVSRRVKAQTILSVQHKARLSIRLADAPSDQKMSMMRLAALKANN